jgi:hypothetical protein
MENIIIVKDRDLKGISIILTDQENLTRAFRLYNLMEDLEHENTEFENEIDEFSGIEGLGEQIKTALTSGGDNASKT